ncbi:MAG: hypothetical protein LBC61_06830 [Candidatus Peribacteria bacterium]|nr:hypothetical protein [Candidatus Peribacteria bacterium]
MAFFIKNPFEVIVIFSIFFSGSKNSTISLKSLCNSGSHQVISIFKFTFSFFCERFSRKEIIFSFLSRKKFLLFLSG